jgi:preprotein translocase subunit SecY
MAVIAMTAGAIFTLWLSELITVKGIGNGGSLLILVGILSRVPSMIQHTAEFVAGNPEKSFMLLLLLAIFLVVIAMVVVLQLAERRVTVVSAKSTKMMGRGQMAVYGGQTTHIPFKINPAGVMPIIFAFAILGMPSTIFGMVIQSGKTGVLYDIALNWERWMGYNSPLYIAAEFGLIVFFTFFYASIVPSMQPREIAENLKKYGSSIPGIKPGRPTAEKLDEILSRTTIIGACALGLICLLASSGSSVTGIKTLVFGSTSLIIMVGVALDTINQIKVHLLARQYEGFLK